MKPLSVTERNELDLIVREVHYHEERSREAVKGALVHRIEIGKRLIRAKEVLPRGDFGRWTEDEFGWTGRHVQRHMELARNATRVSHLASDTSLRVALAAIAPEPKAEHESQKDRKPEDGPAAPEVEMLSAARWRITGTVEWTGENEPSVADLVGACTDWTARKVA